MATSVFVVEKNGATTEIEVNLEQMTGMDLKKEISALNGIPIKKMLLFYTSGLGKYFYTFLSKNFVAFQITIIITVF